MTWTAAAPTAINQKLFSASTSTFQQYKSFHHLLRKGLKLVHLLPPNRQQHGSSRLQYMQMHPSSTAHAPLGKQGACAKQHG
jgi:hypothetical protein